MSWTFSSDTSRVSPNRPWRGDVAKSATSPPARDQRVDQTVPVDGKWSRAFTAGVRSQSRPDTYGPRSTTRAVTVCPWEWNVPRAPPGSVLLATPRVPAPRVVPHAVRPPMKPGPYHDAADARYTVTLPRV